MSNIRKIRIQYGVHDLEYLVNADVAVEIVERFVGNPSKTLWHPSAEKDVRFDECTITVGPPEFYQTSDEFFRDL